MRASRSFKDKVTTNEAHIRQYVIRCFEDAFQREGRTYDESAYSFEYIIIKDKFDKYHLYPFMWCKYDRVKGQVFYRLQRNCERNFGLVFRDGEGKHALRADFSENDDHPFIDPTFTNAVFTRSTHSGIKYISVRIFDEQTDAYEKGHLAGLKRLEMLMLRSHGKSYDDFDFSRYNNFDDFYESFKLDDVYKRDWTRYSNLHHETFGEYPGNGYKFMSSEGIVQRMAMGGIN